MDTIEKSRCKDIADHYGLPEQLKKTLEECGELTCAINSARTSQIVEEIADVEIMLYQLTYLLDIEPEVVTAVDYKLQRQEMRIAEEKMIREGHSESDL